MNEKIQWTRRDWNGKFITNKKKKMLAFLEALKEQHDDDESLIAINQIESFLYNLNCKGS